jgi:hypothetical protein
MEGRTGREALFPGEPATFEVTTDPGCSERDIAWSGGGDPATGTGPRFRTAFATGGSYEVTASCEDGSTAFPVTVCPVDAWLDGAGTFFAGAIDLARVRVIASRLVLGPPGTAWTCNDVIRFKRPRSAAEFPAESTLIHELGHVWEHQSGQAQLLKGIVEQVGRRLGRDPYDFGGPAGLHRARTLTGFRAESQAQIVMELWRAQHGHGADRTGVPFATAGYVDDLRRLVEGAGIGVPAIAPATTSVPARRTFAARVDASVARFVNAVTNLLERSGA